MSGEFNSGSGGKHCNAAASAWLVLLEGKDRPELRALILPLFRRLSSNGVGDANVGEIRQQRGLVLGLFERKRGKRVQFVIESCGYHPGLGKWKSAITAGEPVRAAAAEAVGVCKVVVHHLILAGIQI